MPLEHLSKGGDGEIIRHLRVSARLVEETSQKNDDHPSDLLAEVPGRVWATPGLPFLVFVTVGFVAALFFGDFITWFVVQLISAGIA